MSKQILHSHSISGPKSTIFGQWIKKLEEPTPCKEAAYINAFSWSFYFSTYGHFHKSTFPTQLIAGYIFKWFFNEIFTDILTAKN